MHKSTALISICTDCAQVIANGTDGWGIDEHGRELGELHALTMADSDITLGASAEECRQCGDPDAYGPCEPWFAWSRCECCGTTLGGDRTHATTWWTENDEPAHDAGESRVSPSDGSAVTTHADYPHEAGTLYDCEACEARCHCEPGEAECVYDGEHQAQAPADERTVSIARGIRHLTSDEAYGQCEARQGEQEISDACAATIASWWQGPAGHGATFAALVSGYLVSAELLADAIFDAQRSMDGRYGLDITRDRLALDMLSTWAMNGADAAAYCQHPAGCERPSAHGAVLCVGHAA